MKWLKCFGKQAMVTLQVATIVHVDVDGNEGGNFIKHILTKTGD